MDLSYLSFITPLEWLSMGAVIIFIIVAIYVYKHIKSDNWQLKKALKTYADASIENAVLFDGVDSYLFADYLILLQGKILIVKRDESQGYIFGAGNIHEWTCVKNHVTGKFNNPLERVGHFVTQVKQECGFEGVQGCVLFGSQAEFPKGVPDGVLQINVLHEDMEKRTADKSQHPAAKEAWDKLIQLVERDKSEVHLPR